MRLHGIWIQSTRRENSALLQKSQILWTADNEKRCETLPKTSGGPYKY